MINCSSSRFIKFLLLIIYLFITLSCGTVKPSIQPINNQLVIRDSIQIHQVDSVVIIPKEVIKDVVPVYDTLSLETSKAKARAWVDTTKHILRGEIENKSGIEYKYIYKDRVEYKDSIQVKEVPVPVEVEKIVKVHPWYEKILIFFSLIWLVFVIVCLYKLYLKYKI